MLYEQEKERPAVHEERELWSVAGAVLRPWRGRTGKSIIAHGRLQFGILICSELTNLHHRKRLRSRVDAVFVPEWNRDINSFAALVEAAALDVHCFVVQVNNRRYGDCRIRIPSDKEWERDAVRIRGGENDYFVLGKLDVEGLRQFQSRHRSPENGPFKPVPDGFLIHPSRRTQPGENDSTGRRSMFHIPGCFHG